MSLDPGIARAADDIRAMRVRGAAKIGRHAATTLAAYADRWGGDLDELERAGAALVAARPTAVSLPNAVAFVLRRVHRATPDGRAAALRSAGEEFAARAGEALAAIGRHGAPLIQDGDVVLTICNSQGALTPLFEARRQGRRFEVIALETRPWRQGLLTVRQLADAGIEASLAVDSAAWSILPGCALVLTGADSIARNGDVVNKVGTGGLASLARARGIPVHVCAETFKLALDATTGADVPIEERETVEVVKEGEIPEGVHVRNPVFDVTPHELLTGYVTDVGRLRRDELLAAARKAWEIE